MALRTNGTMAVDWEQRVDLERLRSGASGPNKRRACRNPRWARCCVST